MLEQSLERARRDAEEWRAKAMALEVELQRERTRAPARNASVRPSTQRQPDGAPALTPEPLAPESIAAMSGPQARDALAAVAKARSNPDLDPAVRGRLKREFDLLLQRCRQE